METAKALRRVIHYGLYVVPLLALLVTNSLFFPFITGKNFAFRIIVLLLTGVWVVLMFKDRSARPKKHPITIAYAVFIAIMALATIFSVVPHRSFWSNFERMDGLLNHIHLFLMYLMAVSVFTKEQWKKFYGVSIASSVAAMGYGVFQVAHIFIITQGGVRLESTLGNAIYFGGFLLFNLFVVGYWLREREHRFVAKSVLAGLLLTAVPVIRFADNISSFFTGLSNNGTLLKFVVIVLVFLLIVVGGWWALKSDHKEKAAWGISFASIAAYLFFIYQSGSRGILVGLILGVLTTGILAAKNTTGQLRKVVNRVFIAGALVIVLVVGLGQTSLAPDGSVVDRLQFHRVVQTFETRTTLWGLGVRAAMERPVLGWGPDSFIMAFNKYYDTDLYSEEPWFDRSHNVFVDYLVHTGVLGFTAYIALFVVAFYAIYKHQGMKPLEKAILSGLLVAYVGQNITVFDNLISYIFFFSFLAFLAGWDNKEPESNEVLVELPKGRLELVSVVMLVLVVFGTYTFHIRGIRAADGLLDGIVAGQIAARVPEQAREIITAASDDFNRVIGYNNTGLIETREQFVQFAAGVAGQTAVPEDLRVRVITEALTNIQQEADREALNARAPYFFGLLLRSVGQQEQALLAFEIAQERSPDRQLFMVDRAITLNDLGRHEEALALLEHARGLSEIKFLNLEVVYALVSINAGRTELLDSITLSDVFLDQRVIASLLQSGGFDRIIPVLEAEIAAGRGGSERYLQLAEVRLRQENPAAALEILNEALLAVPNESTRIQEAIDTIQAGTN